MKQNLEIAAAAGALILLLGSCAAQSNSSDWTSFIAGQTFSGDATYYGQQPGQDATASCSFGSAFSNSLGLPWTSHINATVALNAAQYAGSLACGLCVMYRGTSGGIGLTPVPATWQMALVSNKCPECAHGSIDLNLNGNGRWTEEWYPVPCNVGSSTFRYDMGGAPNVYWFMFTVSNTRVPVSKVEINTNGNWESLRRGDPDNHWAANGGPFQFPMQLRLTSVLGDIVYDTLPSTQGGEGTAQFPPHVASAVAAQAASGPPAATQAQAASPPPAADIAVTASEGPALNDTALPAPAQPAVPSAPASAPPIPAYLTPYVKAFQGPPMGRRLLR